MENSACQTESSPVRAYADGVPKQVRSHGERWDRLESARRLRHWDEARERGLGERDAAEGVDVARSTVRRWEARRERQDVHPYVAQFFESPEGVECLKKIVLAIEFVIGLLTPSGIRLVCHFLRLSGLDVFVASSVGSVQKNMTYLEENVVQFGSEQRVALGSQMAPRTITVCQDETFHPEVCLVAIEPASDFILVEQYAEDRKADTWTQVMSDGLKDLPVAVVQGTSDEAKAILAHVEEALEAHHSPDLFHVQHEVSKATSLPMEQRVRQADKELADATWVTKRTVVEQAEYENAIHGPGRPPDPG